MDFKPNTKLDKRILLSYGKYILCVLPIVGLFFIPAVTEAGVFSFLGDIFSGQNASAQAESVIIRDSSQTMSLPEPATNFNPSFKDGLAMVIDGGEALVPEVGPSTKAQEKNDYTSDQISTYVVRSGDTLAGIANMFDVSINTVMWANDMTKNSVLKIGQTLVILPISGVIHTVKSGDTLSTIAKKYGGDVTEISSFNNFNINDKLSIGDTITIPDGEVSSSIQSPTASSGSYSSSNGPVYNGYYSKPFITGHKTQGIHGYNAVDYGMPGGSPLYAAAAGKIIVSKSSGWNGGYGEYIVIQHSNSTQTVYGHMRGLVVSVGQSVKQGQLIGYSGNTGKSTGPHLHFEVRGAKNPF